MNKRRRTFGILIAVLISTALLTSCSANSSSPTVHRSTYPYWKKGAGATEAAAFMKVKIPEGATEVRGAVQVNPREDNYILSFRTDKTTATRAAQDLRSPNPPEPWKVNPLPQSEHFRHLGLTEPETLKGALHAGVCPPCAEDNRRRNVAWIEIYVENLESDRARVYLRAF
ncbi:hypothetical protein [Streptomyces sp. NPDC056061]|uniref:hypothetical protein n=1 Tax=Streptomyces sp. NPDC056061 TaxID=3345700 RepID=UPI0035DC37A3